MRRLDTALSDFIVLGVTTNVGFLRSVSQSEAFSKGLVTTDYLDNISLDEFIEPPISEPILVSIVAVQVDSDSTADNYQLVQKY